VVQEKDYKKQLTSIINDPDGLKLSDIPLLKELVNQYPYFQPLRLILARLSMETEEAEQTLTTTALYTNGALLHQFLQRKAVNEVLSNDDSIEEISFDHSESGQPEEIVSVEEVNDADVHSDEQETFEEIAEVDAHEYNHEPEAKATLAPVIETLEDNFVENIAATDFFAFEENFSPEEPEDQRHPVPPLVENIPDEEMEDQETALSTAVLQPKFQTGKLKAEDKNEVTNYDDDTLPYTFLWWLAKTRKEHSASFQPYATAKKQTQNELHQQYVEHIFHIQSPFNAEEILDTAVQPHTDPKDAKIIDEFIQKDPQISAPRPEQIDNENKAKKSAEDHNDLVSETLAKIYIEQMLYHKAIDTYEKLSLKFPEKSRYFADLIQSIKKKI
jgi:hypothetical protein